MTTIMKTLCLLAAVFQCHALIEWMDKEIKPNVWLKVFVSTPDPPDPDAPLLVLFPGGMGTPIMAYMMRVHPHISKYNFVTAEQRGVLSLNGTAPSSSLAEHVDDLIAVLQYAVDRFRRKAVVWGMSFGGPYALLAADQRADLMSAIVLTGPVVYNTLRTPEDVTDDEIARHESWLAENCEMFLSRMPWWLAPVKYALGCPSFMDNNYWYTIFYFAQIGAKLGLMTRCESLEPFCTPDFSADIFDLLYSPFVGVYGTARIGFSNANYKICENIPMLNISWPIRPVHVPLFVMASMADRIVPHFVVQEWFDQVEAPYKTLHWQQRAGHLMFLDSQDATFSKMSEWINEIALHGEGQKTCPGTQSL